MTLSIGVPSLRASGGNALSAPRAPRAGRALKPRAKRGARASGPCKNKPSPAPAVKCFLGHVITGGMLQKKKMAIDTFEHDKHQFVKVAPRENWLCQIASGKSRGYAPLARTTLPGTLSELQAQAVGGASTPMPTPARAPAQPDIASPMTFLGLDALDGPGSVSPVAPHSRSGRPTGRARASDAPAEKRPKPLDPKIVVLSLPEALQRGGKDSVRVLTRPRGGHCMKKGVYLHVEDVPWCVELVADQVKGGGVYYEPPATELQQPFYSIRDRAWVARSRNPAGERKRRYFTVPRYLQLPDGRKRPLGNEEFKQQQGELLLQAKQWQEDIAEGVQDE